jgi:phosphoenolpyruvate synthase/pyruvate phosphate dikinase
MRLKPMKQIDKIISRDISVIGMYADHVGLTTGLKEWLGWSYSDMIFYFHDNYSDVILPSDEHYKGYLNFVIKKMERNPGWFSLEYKRFLKMTKEFYSFFDNSKKLLEKDVSNKEILKVYEGFYNWMKTYYGIFVLMKWFPIWTENDPILSKKYSAEIKSAIKARKKAELILPKGRETTYLILNKCLTQFPLDKELLGFITKDELSDLLLNKKIPSEKKLKERKLGFVFSRKGISLIKTPEEAKKAIELLGFEYKLSSYDSLKELKGQTACKGIVNGVVRLIMTKKEIPNIKEGEILVTSMTTPEYLPAMKKAAAFVTDEGGITCHAAIVAREMKKPCIIGTKIATKWLKDGDLVEVDADKGIVRKIK